MNSLLYHTCAGRVIVLCVQTTGFFFGRSVPDCEPVIGHIEVTD